MKVRGCRYELTSDDLDFCHMIVCAGYHDMKYHTVAVMEDCLDDGVEGDFAECGVLYGAHPAIMLRALQRRGMTDRKVHLFDSFQGIPRATMDDHELQRATYGVLPAGQMESSGISVSTLQNTLGNLGKWGVYDARMVEAHPGWFQDTLPQVRERFRREGVKLAVLRVDGDLYESTLAVYSNLYEFVSPGGYVIDDDYGGPQETAACRAALERVIGPQRVQHVEKQDTTAWWRKP